MQVCLWCVFLDWVAYSSKTHDIIPKRCLTRNLLGAELTMCASSINQTGLNRQGASQEFFSNFLLILHRWWVEHQSSFFIKHSLKNSLSNQDLYLQNIFFNHHQGVGASPRDLGRLRLRSQSLLSKSGNVCILCGPDLKLSEQLVLHCLNIM